MEVSGDFEAAGLPATHVTYRARVAAAAGEEELKNRMRLTDTVAEVHNTLRVETPVVLAELQAISRR